MSNIVVHNPNGLPMLKISKFKPLQGNLKDLSSENYNKLKKSIEKHGFVIPVFCYDDGKDKWIVDAHQRQRVMLKEGWDIEVPYVNIEAKDLEDAKEILLKVSSQYGHITLEGLDEFKPDWQELDLSFDAIGFADINVGAKKAQKKDQDIFGTNDKTVICPGCSMEFDI